MSEQHLSGKAALVTAASRNLGSAVAAALAQRGARVAVNYHSSQGEADAVIAGMPGSGHVAIRGDAGTPAGVRGIVSAAEDALGSVQVLVNNYGPFSMTPFAEMPEDEWDRIWDANVKATYVSVQAVVPGMREAGWGRIVNMSAGSAYLRNHSIYTLSKESLITLTEALAIELGPEINVNAVAPGQIAESAEDIAEFDPSFVERSVTATPTGRLVTRPEVAAIVAELCCPLFDGVTGVTIPVDGGWRLPRF